MRLRRIARLNRGRQLNADLIPRIFAGLGGAELGLSNGVAHRLAVLVGEVGRDAGAGVGQGSRLHESFDAVVRARLDMDLAGVVPVNQAAAVEVEAEAVLPGAGAV